MDSGTIAGALRRMRRSEFDVIVEWAAAEGWNPGLNDAECFWSADPDGFIAVEVDGALAGGGSIVSYGRRYGFMGFFIVRQDLRGRGIGRRLWHERKRLLLERLDVGAPIGMDGVFAMEPFYAKGGFVREHRELRFEAAASRPLASGAVQGTHATDRDAAIVPIRDVAIEDVIAYDALHFPGPRSSFMRRWLAQPGALPFVALSGGAISGLAMARPARTGMRIGPLFADSPSIADSLLGRVLDECTGVPVHLDVPERNDAAMALAARYGMREVFGCAKMTHGTPPALPWSRIFCVTSFELG